MLLVPKQLLRSGMTGTVPYYGGRFTPAQAYAAAHPTAPPMSSPPTGRVAPPPPPPRPAGPTSKAALDQLLESGVLTASEYDELLGRIGR
jgi:hypothetical protein